MTYSNLFLAQVRSLGVLAGNAWIFVKSPTLNEFYPILTKPASVDGSNLSRRAEFSQIELKKSEDENKVLLSLAAALDFDYQQVLSCIHFIPAHQVHNFFYALSNEPNNIVYQSKPNRAVNEFSLSYKSENSIDMCLTEVMLCAKLKKACEQVDLYKIKMDVDKFFKKFEKQLASQLNSGWDLCKLGCTASDYYKHINGYALFPKAPKSKIHYSQCFVIYPIHQISSFKVIASPVMTMHPAYLEYTQEIESTLLPYINEEVLKLID